MSAQIPLTWAERSVWFASKISPNPLSYNAACIVTIDGEVSTQRLLDAIRCALNEANLLSRRVVSEHADLHWREDTHAASDGVMLLDRDDARDPIETLVAIFHAMPMKADDAPLMMIHVLRDRADKHYILLRHHHVMLDFQGAAALLQRVAAFYRNDGESAAVDRRAEIAIAEKAYINSDIYREDERYWRDRMRGLRPGAFARPAPMSSPRARIDLTITADAFAAFTQMARAMASTPFQYLLMIIYAHLEREAPGDHVFGIPFASRVGAASLNSQSRMLPFRFGLSSLMPVTEAAARLRSCLKQDIERARFPVWENMEALFAGERRGALPKVALNFMRATTLEFGAATGRISRLLYGEPTAETYVRCVEQTDGALSVTVDSGRDYCWADGLGQALSAGLELPGRVVSAAKLSGARSQSQ